jgi:hypothetical protein
LQRKALAHERSVFSANHIQQNTIIGKIPVLVDALTPVPGAQAELIATTGLLLRLGSAIILCIKENDLDPDPGIVTR